MSLPKPILMFFFSSRRRHTRSYGDWSSDVCSSDLRFRGTGPVLSQEVYLEPFGTDVLFAAPRLLHLSVRANAIVVDDTGGVSVPSAAARFRYFAHSRSEERRVGQGSDRRG